MAGPTGSFTVHPPRLLKSKYMAAQESVIEETRGTGLFYFPGPVLFALIFGFLTYAAAAPDEGWPKVAYLSDAIHTAATHLPSVSGHSPITLLFGILFLIGILWILVRYLEWNARVYAVTTERVIIQRGIFGKEFDEIPVSQVRGVDVHQTVLQRILGYGTVRVSSEGGQLVGNEDWVGIPKPFRFQRVIQNATDSTVQTVRPAALTPQPPSR